MSDVQSEKIDLGKIIDHMPVLTIITDDNLVVKYDNTYSTNLFDKIHNENIDRRIGDYMGCINSILSPNGCGNSVNCNSCKLKKIIKDTIDTLLPQESNEMEYIILKSNTPTKLWLKIKTIPIVKSGEKEILVVITDVTEYKKAQNKILSVNNSYNSTMQYFPDMLWKMNEEKRYVYFNENWEELTGETTEKLISENRIIGIHPNDVGNYYKELFKAYDNERTFRIEYRLKAANGDYRNIVSRGNPIYGQNGEFLGFLGIDIDFTKEKKENEELLRLKESAEEANKAKSEFLANMSHEIRTPLNGIIGMTDLTLLTNLTEEQKDNLNIVKSCAHTLLSLINHVLDLSKIEAQKVVIEEIEFNLKSLIQNAINTNLAKANENYVQLHYIIDDEIPQTVIGDGYRIKQVLNNLISNAIKFTSGGIVMLNVKKISNINRNFEVQFMVQDVGIGISEDEMKFLFKSFSQVDGSITRKYGGTGLGLAISQKLVELMGGHIEVESKKGVGSKFYFTIKLQESKNVVKRSKFQLNSINDLKNESILLVEDNKVNRIVIKRMLKEIGYSEIKTASNGMEALKLMDDYGFDIVLMDIQMPKLDGIETVKIIRENEKKTGGHIPIIAITAHALNGDKEKFLSQGMDGYISKPVGIDELSGILNKMKNNICNSDTSIVRSYLESSKDNSKNDYVELSEDIKNNLLDLVRRLNSYVEVEKEIPKSYHQIERIAHDIKSKCEENSLKIIKNLAFKIELAARKNDDINIQINLDKIYTKLKENI